MPESKDADPGRDSRSGGPFRFIGPLHPFYSHAERFRRLLADDPRHQALIRRVTTHEGAHVRTVLRGRLEGHHTWTLRGLEQSFQYPDESRPFGFHAVTILYSASTGRLAWYEFPDDPKLTAAAQFFGAARDIRATDRILRYVPRRRLTFRTSGGDDTGTTLIGKFVRPAELEPAWDRLVKVSRAMSGSPGIFATAAPLGVDDRHHVFFQEARPGQPLVGRLEASNVNSLLRRLGAVHRAIHELPVRQLPEWNPAAFLQILREQVKWVAFFTPEQAGFLDGVLTLLLARAPRMDPRDYTFCHGDFRCSQILTDGDRWSVIDFDGSLRADPYLEIAHVLAFLKYDGPWCIRRFEDGEDHLLDEVYESYLSGYQERASGKLDRRRLLWHRIGCEIHCLARMIRRDLAHPVTVARALRLVRRLSEQLKTGTEAAFE